MDELVRLRAELEGAEVEWSRAPGTLHRDMTLGRIAARRIAVECFAVVPLASRGLLRWAASWDRIPSVSP